jgi:hypothetical protein
MSNEPIIEYSSTEVRQFARKMDLSAERHTHRPFSNPKPVNPWLLRLGALVCVAALAAGTYAVALDRRPDTDVTAAPNTDRPVTTEPAEHRYNLITGCATQSGANFLVADETWMVASTPAGPISGSIQGDRFVVCADVQGEVLTSPTVESVSEIIAPRDAATVVLAIGSDGASEASPDPLNWVFGSVSSDVIAVEIESQGIRAAATIENGMFGVGLLDASFDDATITTRSASGEVSTIDSLNCFSDEATPRLTPRYEIDENVTGGCTS